MVLPEPNAVAVGAVLVASLGSRPVPVADLPPEPWSLADSGIVATALGLDRASCEAALMVSVRGGDLVVGLSVARPESCEFHDGLVRAAHVVEWRASPLFSVDPDAVRMLLALGHGASIPQAAAEVHLSERTAHRRLAEARATLGARSVAGAVSDVLAVSAAWTAAVPST